jgi:pimeloyl-ACP methyl ester carboxylesterase
MVDLRFGSMVIDDQGNGPAVVMVHGLGGTSNSFQTLMPSLGGYRVLRPDLPGAGRSNYRPGVPGMAGLVASVKNAMHAADIERAHFVGHSMGTLICQYIAVESPGLVASLTLFGAIFEPPPAARHGLRERAATAREHGMTGIAEAVSTSSVAETSLRRNPVVKAFVRESLMRQDPMGYATHCEALSEATAASHAKIECSTMLIAGEHDNIAPIAMNQDLAGNIRNARLEIIAGVGHWMMVEAAERSADIMRNHLNELAA